MKESGQEMKETTAKVVQGPIEKTWFEVNPRAIDQSLFKNKRAEKEQEKTRKLILEAFAEVKRNPEKYGKIFKTMMPEKDWASKTVVELKDLACEIGNHNADWVEQALEWAQRICNGESWKTVCNKYDVAKWQRLVVWKNGFARCIGGSRSSYIYKPASFVFDNDYDSNTGFYSVVPLIVSYDK